MWKKTENHSNPHPNTTTHRMPVVYFQRYLCIQQMPFLFKQNNNFTVEKHIFRSPFHELSIGTITKTKKITIAIGNSKESFTREERMGMAHKLCLSFYPAYPYPQLLPQGTGRWRFKDWVKNLCVHLSCSGSGILLFIFHANFLGKDVIARLCGPCSVQAVILNDKFQLPVFLVRFSCSSLLKSTFF